MVLHAISLYCMVLHSITRGCTVYIASSHYVYNMVIIDDDSGDDDGGHLSVVGPVHLRRSVNDPQDLMGSNK